MALRMVEQAGQGSQAQLKKDIEVLQTGIHMLQFQVRRLAEQQRQASQFGRQPGTADVNKPLTATEKEVCKSLGLSEEAFRQNPTAKVPR